MVLIAVLLVLSSGGGYAAARWSSAERMHAGGAAAPVPALPAVPVDPEPDVQPDPDTPPLATGIELDAARLGGRGFGVVFPVPAGWQRTDSASIEAKWIVPTNPSHTYVLRVEQTAAQRVGMDRIVADRIADLEEAEQRLRVVDRGPGSLEFTYVDGEGYARRGLLRWLDLTSSGFAELEVAVTGREADALGMLDLVERVASGARRR